MGYINGKRISYYNIFYQLPVLIGLNILVVHYAQGMRHEESIIKAENDGVKLTDFFSKNIKCLILSFSPLFAVNGRMIFPV